MFVFAHDWALSGANWTVEMASPSLQARKMGWLSKRGGRIHTWHKRWFVLTGDLMFYYKTPQVLKFASCQTMLLYGTYFPLHA